MKEKGKEIVLLGLFCKDTMGLREIDTGKLRDRYGETGRKVRGDSLLAGARMNQGGRPYILGHPP